MEIKQLRYPFNNESSLFSFNNLKFMQIGIEKKWSPALFQNNLNYNVKINNVEYCITDKEILEFNCWEDTTLENKTLTISLQEIDNPYLIINLTYEKEENINE